MNKIRATVGATWLLIGRRVSRKSGIIATHGESVGTRYVARADKIGVIFDLTAAGGRAR